MRPAAAENGGAVLRTPTGWDDRRPLQRRHVEALTREAVAVAGARGRADERLAAALRVLDRRFTFTPRARAGFEALLARLGVSTERPIGLPESSEPFWFRSGHPLADFRSRETLPETADVLIVGAGLTGAACAYHLAEAAARGLRVVVVDRGDPACEASGRNGGHFELLPENSVGLYEGLATERAQFLRRCWPALPAEVVAAEAERQASLVLGLAVRNRERLSDIVQREGLACDFSPRGWLYLAHTEREEEGICEEVSLAARHGERIEVWSRSRIRSEFGFDSMYLGRFIPGDGTYHPFKYVCGLLHAALRSDVELYTRTGVRQIESLGPDGNRVTTERGTLVARCVVVATNAFTSELLPELSAIRPRQSQVMVTEHAPDQARGRIVTSEEGPVFFNQPREGAREGHAPVLMGGGDDRPMKNPASRRRSPSIHRLLLRLRDAYYPQLRGRPPSSEWVGAMGFTPDQLPAIGFLRPGLVVAAGFNGYGGSYTTVAGEAAAEMALTGRTPEWVPEDTFSPRRFLSADPPFLSEQEGLWRIATSLCQQLRAVNREISTAFSLGDGRPQLAPLPTAHLRPDEGPCESGERVKPEVLKAFPAFTRFTLAELREVLPLMCVVEAPAGTRLFGQGDPGDSCLIVVSGRVDVTTPVRGQEVRLATLPPGSIFGQLSLIEGTPRSATCTVREDALLLEIRRGPCDALFRSGSRAALKFLEALVSELLVALRSADRRRMRLVERRFAAETDVPGGGPPLAVLLPELDQVAPATSSPEGIEALVAAAAAD